MATSTEQDIERIITGYNRAKGAADYAATIKCVMEQVDGDNYQMRWSNEYNGGFVPNR